MTPDYHEVLAATWPAVATQLLGPWCIREGQGAGKRVSAATAHQPVTLADLPQAEQAMRALGQTPLFSIGAGDAALDTILDSAGYDVIDPVTIYAAPLSALTTQRPPPIAAFSVWEPLQIMKDLWAEGGIGPQRLAVMDRVQGPKTAILGRVKDRAAGTAFVATHKKTAMIHALEVVPTFRRQGTATNMLREAAFWAQDKGADQLAIVVTTENTAARALYSSLKMQVVGQYHYRIKTLDEASAVE